MDLRRKIVVGAFLLAAGFAAGVLVRNHLLAGREWIEPATPAEWDEQVRRNAISLHRVVSPDPSILEAPEGVSGFAGAWDAVRARYPADRLEDLRRRLHGYLDFVQAEYADCAEIWRTGPRETYQSDAAREARRRLRADFGEFADVLLRQADELREQAYRDSPKVAGLDPDGPDYRLVYEDVRRWVPRGHARVDELTAPVAK